MINGSPDQERVGRVIDSDGKTLTETTIKKYNENFIEKTSDRSVKTFETYLYKKIPNLYYVKNSHSNSEEFYLFKKYLLENGRGYFFIFESLDILAALVIAESYYPLSNGTGELKPFNLDTHLNHNKLLVNIIDRMEVDSLTEPSFGYGVTRLKSTKSYTDTVLMNTVYPLFDKYLTYLTTLLSKKTAKLQTGKTLLYFTNYFNSILEKMVIEGDNFFENAKNDLPPTLETDFNHMYTLKPEKNITLDEQIIRFITIENLYGFISGNELPDVNEKIDFSVNRQEKNEQAVLLASQRLDEFDEIKTNPTQFLTSLKKKCYVISKVAKTTLSFDSEFKKDSSNTLATAIDDFKLEQADLINDLSSKKIDDTKKTELAKKFLILLDKKLTYSQVDVTKNQKLITSIVNKDSFSNLNFINTLTLPSLVAKMDSNQKETYSHSFKESLIKKKETELEIQKQKLLRLEDELKHLQEEDSMILLNQTITNIEKAKKDIDTHISTPANQKLIESFETMILDKSIPQDSSEN